MCAFEENECFKACYHAYYHYFHHYSVIIIITTQQLNFQSVPSFASSIVWEMNLSTVHALICSFLQFELLSKCLRH